tara:strand:- start:3652 stop:4305 length:654 start_codon:yes stop_codon:yes gene_type:complete
MVRDNQNFIAESAYIGNVKLKKKIYVGNNTSIGSPPNHIDYFKKNALINTRFKPVILEDNVVVRDNCVIHCGVDKSTKIGKNSYIMSGSHIDHDCLVEDNCTIAPNVHLAGNVNIKENSQIGMGANIHQNIVVYEYAMVGMGATVVRDVPPFSVCIGTPGYAYKLNEVKLKRISLSKKMLDHIYDIVIGNKPYATIKVSMKERKYLNILKKWARNSK